MGISLKGFQNKAKIKQVNALPPEALLVKYDGIHTIDDFIRGEATTLNPNYTPPDPYWANVVFFANFENVNNLDLSGHQTVTLQSGVTISTVDKKFGTSSVKLPGGADVGVYGGANADLVFGTGDFTIEGWFNISAWGINNNVCLMDMRTGGANPIIMEVSNNGEFSAWLGGFVQRTTTGAGITLGAWNHYAVSRTTGTTKVFINGVEKISITDTYNYTHNILRIGNNIDSGVYENSLNGYIDEFRITKGVGRYTTNFIPVQIYTGV